MGAAAERVEIREVIGVAINATNLGEDATHQSLRHVDLIAAFGLAGCGTLSRRLAEAMWRSRWGGDRRVRKETADLFAALLLRSPWVRRKWKWSQWSETIARFTLACVIEWEHDKCPQCGGVGTIPRSRGRDLRVHCAVCRGGGRRRPHHGERASMIGVTMSVYEKHWQRKYEEALAVLDQVESKLVGPLQAKLRR